MSTTSKVSPSVSVRSTGYMKGTVTDFPARTTFDFYTTEVHRDEAEGYLHVWGDLRVTEGAQTVLTISCMLRDKNLPSGTYHVRPVEHSQVKGLVYHEFPAGIGYDAWDGHVELLNFSAVDHLQGELVFTTLAHKGRHVEVKVTFDIRGFDSRRAPEP